MSGAYVVDSAVACGLGFSLEETWPRLCRGESAIAPIETFETGELGFHHAACVLDLEDGEAPNQVCALMSHALDQLESVPKETFVIWAGVKGNAEYIEKLAAGSTPPDVFLPRHYRQWVGGRLGLADWGLEINAACASSTVALALGAQMIDQGECSSVLVCAADVVSRFTFIGFAALKALSPSPCRPFDVDRDGLSLGDGAVAMLLASAAAAREHGLKPTATLSGWGVTNDANHITGPARDANGLTAAIRGALKQADLKADHLEAWCTHGTGTVYNDAMELTALEEVFGERRFPAFSIKGAIGHTLGAAGALEAAVCTQALREKRVPATSALQTPEARATGRVAGVAQEFAGHNILTTNSGFGGVNTALVLEVAGLGDEGRPTPAGIES